MGLQQQLALVITAVMGWLALVGGSPVSTRDGNAAVVLLDTSPVGYGLLRYASPDFRRSLLGEEGGVPGGLSKRQCTGQLTCLGWTNVCCPRGTTCCSITTCCNVGYGCYSGYCLKDTVYTLTTSITVWTTRYSTYTDYETSYSTYVSLSYDYTTITVRSKNGVATSTEWTTVTREAAKRRQLVAPTPTSTALAVGVHTPLPTKPPRLEDLGAATMELSPNHPGLVRRILERAGVVEKRASTAWITVFPTWTTTFWYYRTSWYYSYVTSVRYSTITSTKIIFDGASSTTTVQSTTTIYTQKPPPAQTPPPNNPPAADPPPANNTPVPPPANEPAPTKPPETVTLTQPPRPNDEGGENNTPAPAPTPPAPDTTPVSVTVFLTPTNIILPTDSSATINFKTSTSAGTVFIITTTEAPTTDPVASTTLPQGTVVGIGVGSALGGIALIAALIFFFLRYRRKPTPSSTDDSTVGHNSQLHPGGGGDGGGHDRALYGVFGRKEMDSRSLSVTVSSPVVGSSSPGGNTGAGTVSSMSPPPPKETGRGRGGSYVSELEQNAGRRTPGMGELHETTRGSELYDGRYDRGGYGFQEGGWGAQELPTRAFSPGLQEMPEEGQYGERYITPGGQDRPVPYRQYDLDVRPPEMGEMREGSEGDPYGLGDVPYPSPEQLARGYGPGAGQVHGHGWDGR
ncbi:hypothetical protein QBC36DRAFT_193136 [Triangularia setosa]|uniref:Uncharacterized protein n=1 Tax=Triangularia setosa TaxID=2587417 RepID=A0AAN7A5L0_9PEZI|nr:hypothetical protein QBC36DRAFT_193136 [Podospora setosa]